MSVLELDAASRSLREAARAWERGELGVDDYRMIRRATLEGKLGLEPGSSFEDASEPGPGATGDPDDDTEVVGTAAVDRPAVSGRGLFIGSVLAAALLLILLGLLLL